MSTQRATRVTSVTVNGTTVSRTYVNNIWREYTRLEARAAAGRADEYDRRRMAFLLPAVRMTGRALVAAIAAQN